MFATELNVELKMRGEKLTMQNRTDRVNSYLKSVGQLPRAGIGEQIAMSPASRARSRHRSTCRPRCGRG